MAEELVTKTILSWLERIGWQILAYDFPQSGTGIPLQMDDNPAEKNKGTIIPDMIAIRSGICVFFENKDRFCYQDYVKANRLIKNNHYRKAINSFLRGLDIEKIYYGIGMPASKHSQKADASKALVHFVISVNEDLSICRIHDTLNIFTQS